MNMFMYLSMIVLAVILITCQAVPVPPFTDLKAEKESQDFNEVGPEENWKVFNQLTKIQSNDPSDTDQTMKLMKEIEGFSRLVTQTNAATVDPVDNTTTDLPEDVTETDSASSDWFGSTWKTLVQNTDGDVFGPRSERQDDGNVEDIIKKISQDLKKLYAKIKRVITVVKNWVNNAKGAIAEQDGPFPMSGSATESDGVFVIDDSLIGDVDKSNRYTVPINAD